jgi:hypothetical protein
MRVHARPVWETGRLPVPPHLAAIGKKKESAAHVDLAAGRSMRQ